ncbi:coiled-coil domain-containing protein 43 isoform X2 [Sabethes cyaneus]|uniref:coiled-coil domain-containing protein 43 isoform X2 n=1 Tax=Sabethes cyaneus TaxID=53552 RepID=UPI00237E725A|nr:coiled-coil domain-containing protein 43 isoform X2 [Sabethes cyaneus]
MAISNVNGFNAWLNGKLREFNTDESVFGSYITGILEGDESGEEKTEALEGILAEIIESDLNNFIKEILDKWKSCHSSESNSSASQTTKLDVDEQLAKLLENQKLAKKVEREYTEEERRIKEQILSQYSQLSESDHEDADAEPGAGGGSGGGGGGGGSGSTGEIGGLARNTNAADVAALVREKREQAKLESQQKKEKDRQDREKQKQLREEKKEKRKTVKGERRR